ncbi:hypothetical protein [Nonomuraea dietziae]|uniref:hypothetical protein n=1 Tax=Nonomuraea dietziae TaxID=65515 RepID=UPI0031D0D1B9
MSGRLPPAPGLSASRRGSRVLQSDFTAAATLLEECGELARRFGRPDDHRERHVRRRPRRPAPAGHPQGADPPRKALDCSRRTDDQIGVVNS